MSKSRTRRTIGASPEEAMAIVYQVAAQETARMMQNATRSQQALQTVSYAATGVIVQAIAKIPTS